MAHLGTIDFVGRSGRSYTFNVYNFGSSWRGVAAVYVVARPRRSASGNLVLDPVYIGQTDNLKEQLSKRHQRSCLDVYQANKVCLLLEASESIRLEVESDLLAQWPTPCNN